MYSHKKGKGIVEKEFGMRKFFHPQACCVYDQFLQQVKTKSLMVGLMMLVISYIAEGCGVAITGGDC